MGNEELANQRHLPRMWIKQRIRVEDRIQSLIELRGKRDMAILHEVSAI